MIDMGKPNERSALFLDRSYIDRNLAEEAKIKNEKTIIRRVSS